MSESFIQQISLDELKKYLWGAAELLRGQIDAAGYKEYIFPLLFFKRINDVYEQQFTEFVHDGGDEFAKQQAEELAIRVPDGAHWNDVRQVTENVGQALVQAFIDIEQKNPSEQGDGRLIGGLDGIFGPKDIWTNKTKMPDSIITSLLEHFSKQNLSLDTCPEDEMGTAYEYLIGKFADDAGNTAQEFYTNRTVVTLMAEILQPKPDESIYDPTCGSGGMLIKCLSYLRDKGEEWKGVHVFGQEINGITSSIARMNLYLNGVEDFSIVCDDTLDHPAFTDGSHIKQFDIVLANPPYSIKNWNQKAFEHDRWGRNFLGTPPQGRADYAFFQHIIASMNDETGRCAILFPHGVLARDEENSMRENLVKLDYVDCIIGIGRNLFYNSPMEACVIVCRKNKPIAHKNKIMFVDAKDLVTRKNAESYLEPHHITQIVNAYNNYRNIEGFCSIINNEIVLSNRCFLTIALYVHKKTNTEFIDVETAYNIWTQNSLNFHESFQDLLKSLEK